MKLIFYWTSYLKRKRKNISLQLLQNGKAVINDTQKVRSLLFPF